MNKQEMNQALENGEGLIGGFGVIESVKLSPDTYNGDPVYYVLATDTFENLLSHTCVVVSEGGAYYLFDGGWNCGLIESYDDVTANQVRRHYKDAPGVIL